MISTQALIVQLHNKENWFVRMEKDSTTKQLQRLFFCRKSSQLILKLNCEVLILDATYKINKYKLLLLIIIEVTALNTSFYVKFTFMSSEYISDYVWVMEQLKELYDELEISYSDVLLTNT